MSALQQYWTLHKRLVYTDRFQAADYLDGDCWDHAVDKADQTLDPSKYDDPEELEAARQEMVAAFALAEFQTGEDH